MIQFIVSKVVAYYTDKFMNGSRHFAVYVVGSDTPYIDTYGILPEEGKNYNSLIEEDELCYGQIKLLGFCPT